MCTSLQFTGVMHQESLSRLLVQRRVCREESPYRCISSLARRNVRECRVSGSGGLCGVCSYVGGFGCSRVLLCLEEQGQRKLQGLSDRGREADSHSRRYIPVCQLHVLHHSAVQPS